MPLRNGSRPAWRVTSLLSSLGSFQRGKRSKGRLKLFSCVCLPPRSPALFSRVPEITQPDNEVSWSLLREERRPHSAGAPSVFSFSSWKMLFVDQGSSTG